MRDAKIDTLYEGTTAIQGQDLFFRKIVKDQGRALTDLSTQITQWIAAEGGNGQLKEERALLQQGLDDVGAIVATMINDLVRRCRVRPQLRVGIARTKQADPKRAMQRAAAATSDPRNVYKVGLNTTRLLMALGDVICAWLLLRGAEVALDRLNGGAHSDGKSLLRRQGRLGPMVCAYGAAQAGRGASHRRGH